MNKERIKWYSTTEIIDTETGEIITKSTYERGNYRIIEKNKKHELQFDNRGNKYGTTTHQWYVKGNEQQRLFD